MKIWTLTTDVSNVGTETAIHFSLEAVEAAAMQVCREHWPKDEGPMPEDFDEAYEVIQQGDQALIWMAQHDITGHPAIAAALEAFDRMQDNIQDSDGAFCNDETVDLMDAGRDMVMKALSA